MSRIRWRYRGKPALIGCALLMVGSQVKAEDSRSVSSGEAEQEVYDLELSPFPYPDEGQRENLPTDAEDDLNKSVPKRGSIFGDVVPPEFWKWKQNLYTEYDLKLSIFYQMLYMKASDTAPFATDDTALGHWWGFDAKWTPLNKAQAYEGSLVLVAAKRGSVGNNAVPAQYGASDLGSAYAVNFEWTEWDFAVEELYWEQWFGKDYLMMRAGNTAAGTMINPFRFKDGRTSFTATPFAFHESIPAPAQGPGFAAKWWPIKDSEFYVTGVLNDSNGNPDDGTLGLDWDSFTKGEYFYAIEFGYIWKKDNGEFNRLFLDIFHNDERSTRDPALPNEPGGGFKVLGSMQQGKWVEFASYTYNTSEGGSTSVSFARHTVTGGLAYLRPFDIQGEVGTGFIWMETFPDLVPRVDLRNQYGTELYWKILVTPSLWVTPGFQYIWNPSLNPTEDSLFIPHIKFRLAY